MRFKVDENLPQEVAELLRAADFECHTVREEGLQGASDSKIATVVSAELRVLVTLDLDFGNIRAYPPEQHRGIIILRPSSQDKQTVLTMVRRLIHFLTSRPGPDQELWIVEPDRIRIRSSATLT